MATDTERATLLMGPTPSEGSALSHAEANAPEGVYGHTHEASQANGRAHEHDPLCSAKHAAWTFLTNHAHVLLCISRNHHETLREVAECVGITERAVQRIVADLEAAGMLKRERQGRKNRYTVDPSRPLRHDLESHATIGDLMNMVLRDH